MRTYDTPGPLRLLLLSALLATGTAVANEPSAAPDVYFPQRHDARELLLLCSSSAMTDRGRQRQRYCAGFLSGVEETVRLAMLSNASPPGRICPPPHITARGLADAFVRFASRHQADLQRPAVQVAVAALQEAFPCPH